MSDDTRPARDSEPEPADPTAEFLAEVRAEETPWRVDRGPVEPPADAEVQQYEPATHFQRAAGAVGRAAPFVAMGGLAGWSGAQAYHQSRASGDDPDGGDATGVGDEFDLGDVGGV